MERIEDEEMECIEGELQHMSWQKSVELEAGGDKLDGFSVQELLTIGAFDDEIHRIGGMDSRAGSACPHNSALGGAMSPGWNCHSTDPSATTATDGNMDFVDFIRTPRCIDALNPYAGKDAHAELNLKI